MPRLPIPLLRTASSLHPCLPLLLRACRDLNSAQNELRWLQEHVSSKFPSPDHEWQQRPLGYARGRSGRIGRHEQNFNLSRRLRCSRRHLLPSRCSRWDQVLYRQCLARSRRMPLQYILGDQPFGAVNVLCRRGVLIPRCVLWGEGSIS